MKKLSLLLMAVAFLCPKVANAQDGKGSVHFVPYVGVNYSDLSGDNLEYGETSGKVNFMAGARFEFQIMSKSALLVDLNYRRLGATVDQYILYWHLDDPYYRQRYSDDCLNFAEVNPDEYNANKYRQMIMERGGGIADFKKCTVDCISFGSQFKQNIVGGLFARVGLEFLFTLSSKAHYRYEVYKGIPKNPQEGGYAYLHSDDVFNHDDFEWVHSEGDTYDDMDDVFSDDVNVAIPLGLTYDYKNFSVNATYHLQFTNSAREDNKPIRNQAFDFTIGYRLPLRKR